MVPKNSDTDPSTPIARRPPSRAPAAMAAAAAETQPEGIAAPGAVESAQADETDPGVGPPAPLRSLPPQTVGVVVPVAAPVVAGPAVAAALADAIAESPQSPSSPPVGAVRQDSVELLLSGISGPRPARARTTPQTGGQASAVYHSEHQLRSGPPPAEQSKNLVIDRPPTPRAIPVAAAAARKAAQSRSLPPEPTVVTGRALARRLVVALVGALVVVAALFTVFQVTRSRTADTHLATAPGALPAPAAAPPPAEPQPTAVASEAPSAAAAASAAPSATGEVAAPEPSAAPAPEASVASAPPAAHPSAHPLVAPSLVHKRRRVGGLPAAPASSGGDVGEFKTTF
ncbi:MAG TPA: hypothetical protein VEK07_06900 [Polyangiaceae bacterium]|nr:hypothetical protein [Polyangiaceae bacterium]